MLETFIIPNFYLPEHFPAMDDWKPERIQLFKDYLTKIICDYDFVKEGVDEIINEFLEIEINSDDDVFYNIYKCQHCDYQTSDTNPDCVKCNKTYCMLAIHN